MQPSRPLHFLIGYAIGAGLFTALLIGLRAPTYPLIFLVAPVIVAALLFRPRIYLPTTVMAAVCGLVGLYNLETKLLPSLQTFGTLLVLSVAVAEICLLYTSPSPRD